MRSVKAVPSRGKAMDRVHAPAQLFIEAALFDVALQHAQPDQLGLPEISIGKADAAQAGVERGDGRFKRLAWLMVGRKFAEKAEIDSVRAAFRLFGSINSH